MIDAGVALCGSRTNRILSLRSDLRFPHPASLLLEYLVGRPTVLPALLAPDADRAADVAEGTAVHIGEQHRCVGRRVDLGARLESMTAHEILVERVEVGLVDRRVSSPAGQLHCLLAQAPDRDRRHLMMPMNAIQPNAITVVLGSFESP